MQRFKSTKVEKVIFHKKIFEICSHRNEVKQISYISHKNETNDSITWFPVDLLNDIGTRETNTEIHPLLI